MSPAQQHPRWYIYHEENGQMVLDRADHSDHIKQAHAKAGKGKPLFVAATLKPLTDQEVKQYSNGRGLTPNLATRPPLTAYEEPAGFAEMRIKNSAAHAARKAKN